MHMTIWYARPPMGLLIHVSSVDGGGGDGGDEGARTLPVCKLWFVYLQHVDGPATMRSRENDIWINSNLLSYPGQGTCEKMHSKH